MPQWSTSSVRVRTTPLCVLFLALVLAGCGGSSSNNALNPQFQPQVANATDNFQFQTTGVTNVTQTLNYTWQDSNIRATINQSTSITAGSASITLRDSANNLVYSGDLKNNGTFTSIGGVAGPWTIQVVLSGVSGTLNFRVQMSP